MDIPASTKLIIAVVAWFLLQPSVCAQEAAECGPPEVKLKLTHHKNAYPLPEPHPGKALVYVMEVSLSKKVVRQTKFAVNGQWVGATNGASYFYFDAEPGLLKLCTTKTAFNPIFSYITVEAGKSYYLNVANDYGPHRSIEMDEDAAKKRIAKSRYTTIEIKR